MRALKSIGSKFRIMPAIREALADLPSDPTMDLLVDVFGGSGSVVMNAGFSKRVYNDADGDLVNFFRVLRDPEQRPALFRQLRNQPMSRQEFDTLRRRYVADGNSLHRLPSIERAAGIFYLCNYSYGGKLKNGGYSLSAQDRNHIKEIATYHSRLRRFHQVAEFWRHTSLEHGSYDEVIATYGRRDNAILYCDPPYFGTEGYYSRSFRPGDHHLLALQLNAMPCRVLVSYYHFDGIEDWYPTTTWEYREVTATKNCLRSGAPKQKETELLLLKRAA